MNRLVLRIVPLLLILFAASLACQAPIRLARHTPTPSADNPVLATPEISPTIESPTPGASSSSGQLGTTTIVITEQQLTTYIQQQLASRPDLPFKNPQVSMKDGEIIITGDVSLGFLTSQATVTVQPYVDQNHLRVKILSARLGTLPFPEDTLKNMDSMINDNLDQLVTQNNVHVTIQDVKVSDGSMTITGSIQ